MQLIELAETVLRALAEPVRVDGHELRISGSIGIVELAAAETTQTELMSLADITPVSGKGEGKGRYAVFDREYTNREIARIELSSSLPGAIERGEFFLDHQALVSFSTRGVSGVEALVRWQHPTLGLLGPDEFIGLAEESGVIVALGHRILAESCAQAHRWAKEFGDRAPFVSVNLAARQLEQPGLVADIASVLADTGLQPSRLQLELTERAVMRESAGPIDALRAFDEMGVHIVIDDFGTGYSNLSYLARLPIHGLKLDGTFITNLGKVPSENDELVVSMLVALAYGLGLVVTAEGVETAAQRERARALGCDLGQGWLLGRPAPAPALGAALREFLVG